MTASQCLSSPFAFFWKQQLAIKVGILLLVFSQIIFYFTFTNRASLKLIFKRRLSLPSTPLSTSVPVGTAMPRTAGTLNLHLWFKTCAKDLNILCNYPMFPKAPDKRSCIKMTMIDANEKEIKADGFRLFGFITPKESGLFIFMVKFCAAEIWLSENESRSSARMVYGGENVAQENTDSQLSSGVDLKAGVTYYIEVVATCMHKVNKLQVLWKTPTNSMFQIINGSVLSSNCNGLKGDLKIYDDQLPDSPACASRRHQKPYFNTGREIIYIAHDDIKDTLPYYEYIPSYTVNHPVPRYHAVTYHVVHTFIFPFPEHPNLRDQKNWIFPLDEAEAFEVVDLFMSSLKKVNPGKFELKEVRNVERKADENRGNRYLIEAEMRDVPNNKSVMLSEYVFMPKGAKQLYYPKDFQWNQTVPVYLVVTAKNLGRWLHHFIKNAESIFAETNDPNFHVIIFDYNSSDINLEEVLKQSSLTNYMLLRQRGAYSRTRSFTEAIDLVKDPQSIIFMMDLHLDIASPFINNIRKHCIEGRMVYTPIIVQMECGANPANLEGIWQVYGYGLIGLYKSDWDRAGGFPIHKNTWGGEDWALMDSLFGKGLEFERMRTTHVYHYHHSKDGLW